MSDVLSQIEQILQGIETRTPRCCDQRCYVNSRDEYAPMHSTSCEAIHAVSVRTEIARTVERIIAEVRTEDPADSLRKRNEALLRAAGGTPQ